MSAAIASSLAEVYKQKACQAEECTISLLAQVHFGSRRQLQFLQTGRCIGRQSKPSSSNMRQSALPAERCTDTLQEGQTRCSPVLHIGG